MAGQSEAADDLIAELAKLMAQDAQDDRKAPATGSPTLPSQITPVRIPGAAAPQPQAKGPAEFMRSFSASSADSPKLAGTPGGAEELARSEQSQPAPTMAKEAEPEPFHFDFDFGSDDKPTTGIEDAPLETAEPSPTPTAQERTEHDTIADLISAELADDPGAVEPQRPAEATPTPTPAASSGPALMQTAVAAGSLAQGQERTASVRTDHDRFKVPPVFGLGSAASRATPPQSDSAPETATAQVPVAAAPAPASVRPEPAPLPPQASEPAVIAPAAPPVPTDRSGLDPIDEIESLIGRAMRVEFDLPADDAAQASPAPEPVAPAVETAKEPAARPALRSLATPVPAADKKPELSAADQAIFAAAEATGARIGWVNAPESAEVEPEAFAAAPRQSGGMGISRALAGPLVAVTLLLAAGFGLYWVLGLGGREDGPAPLLVADETPVKEVAPATPVEDDTGAQSIVFNEIDGGSDGADEQLVSRDQADVNEVTQVAAATPDLSEEGLANRKVRTVKVRPDGTIVSGDESVAGSAILPVDRPNVPVVPGADTAAPELLANVEATEPTPATAPAETATVEPAAIVEPGSTVPAVDAEGNAIVGKTAVVPRIRPDGLTLPTPQTVQATPIAPAETPVNIAGATEVPALADTAPAYVQLASQRSEADARQSAQNMVTRYGPLFGGANLEVQRVDLGVKGIYYRVRVPANSLEQANMICTNVKAAGGDCFTL